MKKIDKLVCAPHFYTMEGEGVGYRANAAMAVDCGKILEVGPRDDLFSRYLPEEVIELKHHMVLPGFIDGHMHTACNIMRGLAQDTNSWMMFGLQPFDNAVNDEERDAGSRVAILEAIRAGTTTLGDYESKMENVCAFIEKIGARGNIAQTIRAAKRRVYKPGELYEFDDDMGEESLNNDFAQYVGVPYEGEIGFSKGDDAQTRMVLDDDLAFQWQEGDEVGLVWMNSDAISYELSHYSYLNESKEIQDWIQKEYGLYSKYEEKVKSGEVIPRDDSYVWGLWPTNWKTFSNTRMTYDGTTWHMTDGQVYKGMYMAYFPLDESRQSTSKFTVTQNAEQAQNATTYTNAEDAKNTISNHILSTVPGEGLVWISENDGDVSTDGATQHSSFLYRLSEQNIESGKADKINIRMRPFSDILDLRINIHEGDMDAAVAKAQPESPIQVNMYPRNLNRKSRLKLISRLPTTAFNSACK